MTGKVESQSLAALIERGGVYYNVSGSYPDEIIAVLIGMVPVFPSLKKNALLQAMLEREALMSTAIGRGIALPHPRVPVLGEGEEPFVAIGFPIQPPAWNAPDGSKIHTVFLIVSSSAEQHLDTLSKINFLCQQEKFYSLVEARPSREEIVAAIREAEAAWTGAS
jgi:PTS system nitrogen regulatory IIA component